jgi:glutathione S-transferase
MAGSEVPRAHAEVEVGALRLYDSPYSPNARKVRATAAELDLDLDLVEVDLLGGGTRTAQFLELNPNGKLPVLVHEGWTLWESNAILAYLAALRPRRGLHPLAPRQRADVDRWLFWQISHLSLPVARAGFERLVKPLLRDQPPDEGVVATAMGELHPWLTVLDASLESSEWLAGQLSIADFAVGAWVELLGAAALLDDWPGLRAWLGRLDRRPSWHRTRGGIVELPAVRRSA